MLFKRTTQVLMCDPNWGFDPKGSAGVVREGVVYARYSSNNNNARTSKEKTVPGHIDHEFKKPA